MSTITRKKISKHFLVIAVFFILFSGCKKKNDEDPIPASAKGGITLIRNGVNTEFNTLSEIPWGSLVGGDVVNIKYQPTPFREKIVISSVGTPNNWIKIVGIPGPNGELPIIDGEYANTKSGQHIAAGTADDLNTRSLICIANRPTSGSNWGRQPKYISIENLEIRNADEKYKYTTDGGSAHKYDDFTAAIWVDRVEGFSLKNCVIHDSGLGLFVNSRAYDEPNGADISKNILIDGNKFYNNGKVGVYLNHNTYVEAIGVTYQYNQYMALRDGAQGSTLKDRSSGTVVRYNYFVASARTLDLVEAEESAKVTILDSKYKETHVYGNVLYNGPKGATAPIHYGGDKYNYDHYRRGTLYFYNNTVINEGDQLSEPAGRYYMMLFQLPGAEETGGKPTEEKVELHNNIIYNLPHTPGAKPTDFFLLAKTGNMNIGNNWISPGYNIGQNGFVGNVTGEGNFIKGDATGKNDPGFTDYKSFDFTLKAGSNAIDKASDLPDAIQALNPLLKQYVLHQKGKDRPVVGSSFDLGAFEFGN